MCQGSGRISGRRGGDSGQQTAYSPGRSPDIPILLWTTALPTKGENRVRPKVEKKENKDTVDDFPYGHVVLLSHLMSNNTPPGPGPRFYRGATCQAYNNQLEITLHSRV